MLARIRLIILRLGRLMILLGTDPELRRALRVVYDRLDDVMPEVLPKAGPAQMTDTIAGAITQAGVSKVTGARIEAVAALYNPIRATIRAHRK